MTVTAHQPGHTMQFVHTLGYWFIVNVMQAIMQMNSPVLPRPNSTPSKNRRRRVLDAAIITPSGKWKSLASEFFALLHNFKNLDLVQILKTRDFPDQQSCVRSTRCQLGPLAPCYLQTCPLYWSIPRSITAKIISASWLDKFTGKSSPERFPCGKVGVTS